MVSIAVVSAVVGSVVPTVTIPPTLATPIPRAAMTMREVRMKSRVFMRPLIA
jgi:hypothetical protein